MMQVKVGVSIKLFKPERLMMYHIERATGTQNYHKMLWLFYNQRNFNKQSNSTMCSITFNTQMNNEGDWMLNVTLFLKWPFTYE